MTRIETPYEVGDTVTRVFRTGPYDLPIRYFGTVLHITADTVDVRWTSRATGEGRPAPCDAVAWYHPESIELATRQDV